MKRRAFVFTLDALLSLVLVVIFITSIVSIQAQSVNVYSTYVRSQNAYTAQNVLELLRTTPLENLVPSQKIEEWISRGILNSSLVSPTMSPLEIAATYWAASPVYSSANLTDKASIILGYILNNTLKGYNYQLIINNYTNPYLSKIGANYLEARDVSAATISLTGYAYNKTAAGYMARLYLAQITKQDEYIYMSDAVLSYPYFTGEWLFGLIPKFDQSEVKFSYNFNISSLGSPDSKVSSTLFFEPLRITKLEIEICNDTWGVCDLLERLLKGFFNDLLSQLSTLKVSIKINGNPLIVNGNSFGSPTKIGSIHLKVTDNNLDDSTYTNLLELIQKQNTFNVTVEPYKIDINIPILSISIKLPFYAIGDSGASHVIVVYNVSKFNTMNFPHRFYFPTVSSEGNPTQVEKAIFIPFNITRIRVQAKIEGVQQDDVTLFINIKDKSINIGHPAENNGYFVWTIPESLLPNLTNQYFSVVLGIGLNEYHKYPIVNFSNPNIFPETHFKLYGNSSYVEIDYNPHIQYSIHTISLTRPIQISASNCDADSSVDPQGEYCRHLEFSFDLPNNITPIWTKFQFPYYHDVTVNLEPYQKVSIQNSIIGTVDLFCYNIQGCNPPTPSNEQRDIMEVFNHWGYGIWTRANDNSIISPTMAPGENKFILDFDDGFYVSKDNSMGETLILLDSYVPYGDTFPYLLQGYPEYTGYNLTYYYEDINGNIKSDNLLIGIPYERNINYKKINIADLQPERYALDDAIVRLFKKLGGQDKNLVIPIKLESTISDVIPLQNVPSLYTPVTVTLRVWRER